MGILNDSTNEGPLQLRRFDGCMPGASTLTGVAPGSGGSSVQGLSTAHICRKYGRLAVWEGGTSIKVSKPEIEGFNGGGGVRGRISGFSRQSRRRLQKTVSKTQKDNLPIFVTLTYPSEYPGDPKEWKKHLHNFLRRLAYAFEGVSGIWKLEPQKRGAPHYHLMVWGVGFVDLLMFVPEKWYQVVGSGDERHLRAGTRVEKVRSWKGVVSYCSKYLGKEVVSMPGWEFVGRYWGVFQRDNVPWAALVTREVTYKQAVQIMRYFRRYAHLKSRSYRSLEIFVNDTSFWLDRLDELLE